MIDVQNLANSGALTAADFIFKVGNDSNPSAWTLAPAPADFSVRIGRGRERIRSDYDRLAVPCRFSMDFLDGKYAQTVYCKFETLTYQSLRDLLIFLIGIFSTLAITFGYAAWVKYENKKNSDPE